MISLEMQEIKARAISTRCICVTGWKVRCDVLPNCVLDFKPPRMRSWDSERGRGAASESEVAAAAAVMTG